MDEQQKQPLYSKWGYVIIGLLAIILITVLFRFVFDLKNLYRAGVIRPAISRIHRRTITRPEPQPQQIQSWMTFNYINYLFHLPADYLSSKLKIKNSSSLNLTLDKYAGQQKLNKTTFLETVRKSVTEYLSGGSK